MGQFANTLFSLLLGWVQTAASWLWSLITNADVSMWLRWLLDNWLPLVLLLCGAGLVIDFVIYLFRWQPYRVWASALRHLTHRGGASGEESDDPSRAQRQWVYADGTIAPESREQLLPEKSVLHRYDKLNTPVRPVRRADRYAPQEQSYHQPVYPPQWQKADQEKQGENE